MELWANAASAKPEVVERDLWQQLLRWFEELLDRDTVVLVVVLPILVASRRSERDVAADRLGDVHPKSVCVRQGIDQPVHHVALGWHQFRVLTTARIDLEASASEQCRHIVRVQASCVHDRTCRDRFSRCAKDYAIGNDVRAYQRRSRKHEGVLFAAKSGQRMDQRFGLDHARVR